MPHKLGAGLKLGEMVGVSHGPGAALVILTAAMRERRGGGDFDWDSNYYGPERDNSGKNTAHNINGGPIIEEYNTVAKRTIGRWAGDRIAIVGDYAEDSDLPAEFKASEIYGKCHEGKPDSWLDVTDDVAKVIEHEVGGTFEGEGWREFKRRDGQLIFLDARDSELVADALEIINPDSGEAEHRARYLASQIRGYLPKPKPVPAKKVRAKKTA